MNPITDIKYRYYTKSVDDLIGFAEEVKKIEKPSICIWYVRIKQFGFRVDEEEVQGYLDFQDQQFSKINLVVKVSEAKVKSESFINFSKVIHFEIRGD